MFAASKKWSGLGFSQVRDAAYPEAGMWLDALAALLVAFETEYESVAGLLVAVGGGCKEAHMLRQILFWWGRGAEQDAIWKSNREWLNSPAMLTRSNVETARRNLHVLGLVDYWQPAHSLNRAMRYRLHEFRLVARIAQVTGLSTASVFDNLTRPCAETPQVDVQKPRKTYIETYSNTSLHDDDGNDSLSSGGGSEKKTETPAVVTLLSRFGCDAGGAWSVAHADEALVVRVIDEAAQKTGLKSKQAWAISEIKRRSQNAIDEKKKTMTDKLEQFVEEDATPVGEETESAALSWANFSFDDVREETMQNLHELSDEELGIVETDVMLGGMKARDVWDGAYHQLELQFDRASFDTWLREATYLGMGADGEMVVGVHSEYAQEMLQGRLYRNMRRVVSDIAGERMELRFVERYG